MLHNDSYFDESKLIFAPSKSKSAIIGQILIENSTGIKQMRISMSNSGTPPVCGSVSGGEVEDYLINIVTVG